MTFKFPKNIRVCVIGLGYVGLPLAVEFGKKYETIGYDLNQSRIADLRQGVDRTKEIEAIELVSANRLSFTSSYEDVSDSNVYIITVPTPLDKSNNPDLRSIKEASNTVDRL